MAKVVSFQRRTGPRNMPGLRARTRLPGPPTITHGDGLAALPEQRRRQLRREIARLMRDPRAPAEVKLTVIGALEVLRQLNRRRKR